MTGVEVYFFSLDAEAGESLSPDEHERAARFRFDRDRRRYIACRSKLRELLGEKLRLEPASLHFSYGKYGKPALERSELFFNVSHSHDTGMIAIAEGSEVGCDIERVDPRFAGDRIPERFFSPSEAAALRALPQDDRCEAFFRCWTRKEAFIKACGLGVFLALDSFDVTLGKEAALLRGADGWSLQAVEAPEGYAAAVVARGEFLIARK